jgi:hypothetical protein
MTRQEAPEFPKVREMMFVITESKQSKPLQHCWWGFPYFAFDGGEIESPWRILRRYPATAAFASCLACIHSLIHGARTLAVIRQSAVRVDLGSVGGLVEDHDDPAPAGPERE